MFEKYKVRKTVLGVREIAEIFMCDKQTARLVIAEIKNYSRIEKRKNKVNARDYLFFTMQMPVDHLREFAKSLQPAPEQLPVSENPLSRVSTPQAL